MAPGRSHITRKARARIAVLHDGDHKVASNPEPTDLDVYRSARLLILNDGPAEAARHALQRAIELQGDLLGQAVWLRIFEAVKVLAQDQLNSGGHVH